MLKRVFILLVFLFSQSCWGITLSQAGEGSSSFGPRKQIATIVYMGLAGAVLGLSTLSFYGRPQDHQTNIAIGFGAGVIIGTVYMTYNAATNPSDFYNSQLEREQQRDKEMSLAALGGMRPLSFKYKWEF